MNSARRGALEMARLASAGRLSEAATLLKRTLADKPLQGGRQHRPESVLGMVPEALRGLLDRVTLADWFGPDAAEHASAQPSRTSGGAFLARSFSNDAGTRPYKLYVPTAYRGQPLPLVVMLHGCSQSPDDFAVGTRMNEAAESARCFVAYPGQIATANHSRCWNWFNPDDQQRGGGEPSLIAGITRAIMGDYAIDPRRVYIAGLSAGGAAAVILASSYPELYAAVGVHSGLACGAAHDVSSAFLAMRSGPRAAGWAPARPDGATVPSIVFHGDRDITVHASNADDVVAQLSGTGVSALDKVVSEGRVPGGHGFTRIVRSKNGRALSEQWVVHGAGHSWSGGSPAGSYTDPSGPDATGEMLRFFLEHPHP